jgi:chromatin remodeling complex protein RSC6
MPSKKATKSDSHVKKNSKAKTTKTKSNSKSVETLATENKPEPVTEPVTEPVQNTSTDEKTVSHTDEIMTRFNELTQKLVDLRAMETSIMSELKSLQKDTVKYIKTLNKRKKKKQSSDKVRAPSGFAKPTKMSDMLCNFMDLPVGTEMARTDVTKYITKYVKEKDLQNPENKRQIMCDTKLKGLLNVDDTVPVTYFNLQKYMKVHFFKAEQPNAVVV